MAWIAGAALAAAQLYQQMSAQKRAAGQAQDASAQQDLAQRRGMGAGRPPFQSVASQFASSGSAMPGQAQGQQSPRISEALGQENAQNEARLRAIQQGTSVADRYRQMPAIGAGAGAPPGQGQPTYRGGTRVDPTGQYSMSSVPQTTQNPGMGVGGYANLIGSAAQIGSSMQGQAPPPVAPNAGAAPSYSPTAMQMLQMMRMRQQGQGRRYF